MHALRVMSHRMDTVVETLRFGSIELELERPLQPDALIDDEAFAEDEFLPYWAELWPSGLALAEHLAQRNVDLAGAKVLEIGCGLGLPSLVAALRGADVLAVDWSFDAVELLRCNAARNGTEVRAQVEDWRLRDGGGERFDLVCAADVLYEERYVAPLAAFVTASARAGAEALIADPGRRHAAGFTDLLDASLSVRQIAADAIPRGSVVAVSG